MHSVNTSADADLARRGQVAYGWGLRLYLALLGLSLGMAACGDSARSTQVVLVVDSDLLPGVGLSRVEVAILDPAGVRVADSHSFPIEKEAADNRETQLPFSLAVQQGSESEFLLRVVGYAPAGRLGAEVPVVTQQVRVRFQEGRTLGLLVELMMACAYVRCDDGRTCIAPADMSGGGSCEAIPGPDDLLEVQVGQEIETLLDPSLRPDAGAEEPSPVDSAAPTPVGETCRSDEACDDGRFCTGVERCVAVGAEGSLQCVVGALPCLAPQSCDEAGARCSVGPTDPCAAGEQGAGCANLCESDSDCDNGRFCDGAERCDPESPQANGFGCVAGASTACETGQVCDEGASACVACDGDTVPDAELGACVQLTCADDPEGGRCDDGVFCNGQERCDPGATDADHRGCVPGAPVCAPEVICDARLRRCLTCEAGSDGDGDGVEAEACGGGDCDDNDVRRYPGAPERCDGIDNDCDGEVDGPSASATCGVPRGGKAECVNAACLASCPAGSTLSEDGSRCIMENDCVEGACAPGSCVDGVDGYSCDCPEPFLGTGTTACRCPTGTALNAAGLGCQGVLFGAAIQVSEAPLSAGDTPPVVTADPDGVAFFAWADEASGQVYARGYERASSGATRVLRWERPSPWEVRALHAVPLGSGQVLVVVSGIGVDSEQVRVARLSASAGFDPQGRLDGTYANEGSSGVVAAGNGQGQALVAWYSVGSASDGSSSVRRYAAMLDGATTGTVEQLDTVQGATEPMDVALDQLGRGLIADSSTYIVADPAGFAQAQVSTEVALPLRLSPRSGSGVGGIGRLAPFTFEAGWGAAVLVTESPRAESGVDAAGNVLTAWAEGSRRVVARFSADEQAWSAGKGLPAGDAPAEVALLALDVAADGRALVGWIDETGAVWGQQMQADGETSEPALLNAGGPKKPVPGWLAVRVGPEGSGLVAWTQGASGEVQLWMAPLL